MPPTQSPDVGGGPPDGKPPAPGPSPRRKRGAPPLGPDGRRVRFARRVAITGLCFGLVPCCPPTGFVGSMLGLLVLVRDRDRTLPAAIRRLATAAVLVGALGAMLNAWLVQRGLDTYGRQQEIVIRDLVATAFGVDPDGAGGTRPARDRSPAGSLEAFAAEPPVTPEAIAAFRAEVEAVYGTYEGVSFLSRSASGTTMRPIVEAAVRFDFERGEPLGTLVFTATPPRLPDIAPILRIRTILIDGPGADDIRFGPPIVTGDDGDAAAEQERAPENDAGGPAGG